MTVTVITGAASGMGRLCVERLRGTTDHLVAVDLAAPRIDGTVGVEVLSLPLRSLGIDGFAQAAHLR